jgi:hypothetical protein
MAKVRPHRHILTIHTCRSNTRTPHLNYTQRLLVEDLHFLSHQWPNRLSYIKLCRHRHRLHLSMSLRTWVFRVVLCLPLPLLLQALVSHYHLRHLARSQGSRTSPSLRQHNLKHRNHPGIKLLDTPILLHKQAGVNS